MRLASILAMILLLASCHSIDEDLTFKYEQGVRHHKGLTKKELPPEKHVKPKGAAQIPDKLDLRPELTQIEDQGACGSCWAFSLTATHRDGHAVMKQDPGRLSQEWLVDNSPESYGCNGGYFDSANDLLAGQPKWSDCPYKEGSGNCPKDTKPVAHIKSWYMLGSPKKGPSTKDIETVLTESKRPVSVTVAAGTGYWEYYKSGVYNACSTGQTDHMINIVGFDNEGAEFDADGNLPPGKGIWILRNSWGTVWGEKGWMRSKMTDKKGKRCNNVGEEASAFVFDYEPAPLPNPKH